MQQHYPLVTVVGGSGFVGRHTVKALANAGYRVRVLVRDTIAGEYLKTVATVGQIAIEYADITRPETLSGKLTGSDAVVNLVSIAYESGRQKFDAINIVGANAIAAEAKKAGVGAFIHVSALGVDNTGDTKYGSTKLTGEEAVRVAFPEAVILRPSLIIGPEDHFFQRFARMAMISPALPLIGGGNTKFQPVLVTDVAQAILTAVMNPACAGHTYELAGSDIFSFRALLELMASVTGRHRCLVNVPGGLLKVKAWFCEKLPFPPLITRDQIRLLAHDNVATPGIAGFAELGIVPAPIADALPKFLSRYIKS
jgi:NADH dehydrogenase